MLSSAARDIISNPANTLFFSGMSLLEISIKSALGRVDFRVDADRLRRSLIDNAFVELPLSGAHAVAVVSLPSIHKDPFDRSLVAQATIEGLTLVTADRIVARYPGPIRLV